MDRRRSHSQNKTYMGNFHRSRAARDYYSLGAHAAKVEEKRDEVSIKYYSNDKRIERRFAFSRNLPKIICALIICSCAIIIIFARSKIYDYQLENTRLAAELETERDKTASIIAQSTEKIDLAYVEEAAKTRLNMAKPQSYQIVYIEIPKTDYTVMHEAATVIEKEKPQTVSYKSIVAGIKDTRDFIMGK